MLGDLGLRVWTVNKGSPQADWRQEAFHETINPTIYKPLLAKKVTGHDNTSNVFESKPQLTQISKRLSQATPSNFSAVPHTFESIKPPPLNLRQVGLALQSQGSENEVTFRSKIQSPTFMEIVPAERAESSRAFSGSVSVRTNPMSMVAAREAANAVSLMDPSASNPFLNRIRHTSGTGARKRNVDYPDRRN